MSSVKKCVVPAAGLGTRFLPATKAVPKEMLPIVDIPTIQYIVEEAVAAGVENVILIQGRYKAAIEDHFDISYELERTLKERGKNKEFEALHRIANLASLTAIRQKEPLGLGHAVRCAEQAIGNEPFAVALGDDLIDAQVPGIKQLVDCYDRHKKGVVALMRVPESQTHLYGIAAGPKIGEREIRIDHVVEKPKKDAPSNLAVIGRYVLPSKIFLMLKSIKPGVGGEIQLTDGLAELARVDGLIGYEFEGVRHDAGDRLGYLEANIAYALKRPELHDGLIDYMKKTLAAEKK
ncbi:MAG: UTP--glucose-1-phosphate uridylyltransferase GalU [Deltaproteobacteria bacterium]|nr:UTP--glucose-1-phosphate uridylyltransferase GalU [Deltaproteobacteria bacterium]